MLCHALPCSISHPLKIFLLQHCHSSFQATYLLGVLGIHTLIVPLQKGYGHGQPHLLSNKLLKVRYNQKKHRIQVTHIDSYGQRDEFKSSCCELLIKINTMLRLSRWKNLQRAVVRK